MPSSSFARGERPPASASRLSKLGLGAAREASAATLRPGGRRAAHRRGQGSVGRGVSNPARDVRDSDAVAVDGRPVGGADLVVYALNKPPGVSPRQVTRRPPDGGRLVPPTRRLYPVGRLDADVAGLILLTNDGELANRLTHPSYEVGETYRVAEGPPCATAPCTPAARGGQLDDGRPRRRRSAGSGPDKIELSIHEGRKRQVKRMCAPSDTRCRACGAPLGRIVGEPPPGASLRLDSRSEIEGLRKASRA